MSEQIQTVVDSTVFGGQQLLSGGFTADFVIGYNAGNSLLTLQIGLDTGSSASNFNIDGSFLLSTSGANFAGVTGLNLQSLNAVSNTDLGIFTTGNIVSTLTSLSSALNNVNKVASYLGGLTNRLSSQEDSLKSQITNYNAAISRIEDADVAQEQLDLIKAQFLQQTSVISLAQANQNPQTFLQLLR